MESRSRNKPREDSIAQEDQHSSERIRVLIAHEVRLLQDSFSSLLERWSDFTVIGFPSRETGCRKKQEGSVVDVVLAIAGLSSDAVDQIQRIRSAFPSAKVVIIGVSGTSTESLEYIEAGASGYILPDSSPEHLIETIRKVHRGEVSCPPDILSLLFERIASLRAQLQTVQDIELNSLTKRELEVFQLVADGMSNKEIAACLKLELQTVKNHVHSILEKLRVKNRQEAITNTRNFSLVAGRS